MLHYATRRVYVSTPTYNPDDEWMMQQARNVSMWIEDEGIKLKYLIRDGDGKFSIRFDEFFGSIIKDNDLPGKSRGRVITDPVRVTTAPSCPPQNGYVESWIARCPADSHLTDSHLKQECLKWFVCFSLGQFNHNISNFQKYHNEFRPHQGLNNNVISPDFEQPKEFNMNKVKRKSLLSGVLNHYYIDDCGGDDFDSSEDQAA